MLPPLLICRATLLDFRCLFAMPLMLYDILRRHAADRHDGMLILPLIIAITLSATPPPLMLSFIDTPTLLSSHMLIMLMIFRRFADAAIIFRMPLMLSLRAALMFSHFDFLPLFAADADYAAIACHVRHAA